MKYCDALLKNTLCQTVLVLSLTLLAGCAANGGTGNPLVRPFQYFSYLNGDDIRAACEPGATSRYRMVYNAQYEHQVRAYDITQGFEAETGQQETRVFSRGLGGQLLLSHDGAEFEDDHSLEPLSRSQLIKIDQALISAGFEAAPKIGLRLHSDEFYWIAMVCRDGVFKYQAWTKDTVDIEKLPFIDVLSAADKTGIDVARPQEPVWRDRGSRPNGSPDSSRSSYFMMELIENGLRL